MILAFYFLRWGFRLSENGWIDWTTPLRWRHELFSKRRRGDLEVLSFYSSEWDLSPRESPPSQQSLDGILGYPGLCQCRN